METGKLVPDICREHGISQPSFYQWKSKYSRMDVPQLKRVKELEAELAQYKKIVDRTDARHSDPKDASAFWVIQVRTEK